VAGGIIRVEERVYKRKFNTPKNGKTREGAISDGTLALLNEWAELGRDRSPDGFLFPSEKVTTPISLDNLWRRNMRPVLDAIGMEWATFQVLRKTNASLSKKAGVEGRRRSEGRLRPEGPRARRQLGGLHELRPGAEASRTSGSGSRRPAEGVQTATPAVSMAQVGLME
jgi:integrase